MLAAQGSDSRKNPKVSNLNELKQLNDKLDAELSPSVVGRVLLELVTDGYAIVSRKGVIVMASAGFATMFGYQPDELLGCTVQQLVPEAVRDRHLALMASWWERPRPLQMGRRQHLPAMQKDGTEVQMRIALTPAKTDSVLVVVRAVEKAGNE